MSNRIGSFALLIVTITTAAGAEESPPAVPSAADATYHQHVAPIVKKSCRGCHGGKSPKGRLSVESLGQLLAGGKKGKPIVPGKPDESRLYQLVSGAKKPVMPPKKAEPLSEAEILTFRAWSEGGAKAGEPVAEARPYAKPPEAPVYPRPPVVVGLTYSSDGKQLIVGGYRELLVHDVAALIAAKKTDGSVASLDPKARLVGEAERIQDVSLSVDGKRLAVAAGSPGRFGEVQIWELESGKLAAFRRIGEDVLYSIDYSPDGSRLATVGTDRVLHVLDAGDLKDVYASEIHSDWIFGVAFTVKGAKLFSGGRDKTLKASEAADGKFLKTVVTFGKTVSGVLGRPDSDQVLAFSETREARFYRAKDLKESRKLENQPGPILAGAFSRDGKRVALGGASNEIRVYQCDDGKRVATLPAGPEWIFAVALSPDGSQLAAAGYEGVVRLYDLKESKQIAEVIPVTLQVRESR